MAAPNSVGGVGYVAQCDSAVASVGRFTLLPMWFATMQESRCLIHVYTLSAVFVVFG